MRIPSSSSFLLVSLAVSSSSSSLAALAAPAGESTSSVVTTTQSCTMSSIRPSATGTTARSDPTSAAMLLKSPPTANAHLAARGLLDLADALKPIPLLGPILGDIFTKLGLGSSPGAAAVIESADPATVQAAVAQAAENIEAALQSVAAKATGAVSDALIPIPVSYPVKRHLDARGLDLFGTIKGLPIVGQILAGLLTQLGLGPGAAAALVSSASISNPQQVESMLAQAGDRMRAILEAEISKAAKQAPVPLPVAPANGTAPFSSSPPSSSPSQTPKSQKRAGKSDKNEPLPSPWSPTPSSTYSTEPTPSSTKSASSSVDSAQAFGMHSMATSSTSSAWPCDMTPSAMGSPPLLTPKMPQNPPNSPEMRGFNGGRPGGAKDW